MHAESRVWFEDDAGGDADQLPPMPGFQFPHFGESPGVSPELTPASSPRREQQDLMQVYIATKIEEWKFIKIKGPCLIQGNIND